MRIPRSSCRNRTNLVWKRRVVLVLFANELYAIKSFLNHLERTMAERDLISLIYYGKLADQNKLDLYDASYSYQCLARTLAIIGHYYVTQKIIAKAPSSAMPIYILPAEEGSFKQTVAVALITSIIQVPFTVFATRLIESWIPQPDPQLQQIIELLTEQNTLLRKREGLAAEPTAREKQDVVNADKFINDHSKEVQVLRSVTSNSFKGIFRPIGRSADIIGWVGGTGSTPQAIVDAAALARIEADDIDDDEVTVMGVVNSFSRSSKVGIVYSSDLGRGFKIEYRALGRLPREDDFSWSQFTGNPIIMTGRFVRFFDGKLKKFLVSHARRVTDKVEISEYFSYKPE